MSQRPAAAGSKSTPFHDASQEEDVTKPRMSLSGTATTPRLEISGPTDPRRASGQNDPGLLRSTVEQSTSDEGSSSLGQRPSRSIGMQNILNPVETGVTEVQSRRRKHSQLESPPTVASALRYPPSTSLSQFPTDNSIKTSPPSGGDYTSAPILGPRHILTPRAPAVRAASLESASLSSASIDAKQSPFVSSRNPQYADTRAPEMSSASAVWTPPGASRPIYGYSAPPAPTPAVAEHRRSVGAGQAPSSQSNSPSTSYSSYSQPSRNSPGQPYSLIASSQAPSSAFYPPQYPSSGPPQIALGSDTSYGPVASSLGQNTYQLMTLDTDQGPIQVPVDVQAASKMADEKRKRNAGASARFRQRRKEKEREASQTIAKLEQRIRDISEESEFYRVERDYFRSIAYSTPGQAQLTQRPPSPRQRRQMQLGGSGPTIGMQWQGAEDREGQGRNTRRRTSGYAPSYALPPPPPPPPMQPVPPSANVPNHPSAAYSPGASFQFPIPDAQTRSAGLRPLPPPGPLPPRTGPYDPTAPPVYDRSWPPGR
ncbi:MAG: hypothetical protein LQ347_005117 [Umbilicaria vellea]|nr:MAG: hypothetical protein LQ347_005117 [Umbilicaria vellea]